LSVPLTAIILGVGGNIIGNIFQSRERQLKLCLRAEVHRTRSAPSTTLQQEIAARRIEERMGRVETRLAARQVHLTVEDPPVQQMNRR
jgi:hypothetical protein